MRWIDAMVRGGDGQGRGKVLRKQEEGLREIDLVPLIGMEAEKDLIELEGA